MIAAARPAVLERQDKQARCAIGGGSDQRIVVNSWHLPCVEPCPQFLGLSEDRPAVASDAADGQPTALRPALGSADIAI